MDKAMTLKSIAGIGGSITASICALNVLPSSVGLLLGFSALVMAFGWAASQLVHAYAELVKVRIDALSHDRCTMRFVRNCIIDRD